MKGRRAGPSRTGRGYFFLTTLLLAVNPLTVGFTQGIGASAGESCVHSGAAGARLTGAGFGGCVVALVRRNHADDVLAKTTLRYREATGIEPSGFVAHAIDGAHMVDGGGVDGGGVD